MTEVVAGIQTSPLQLTITDQGLCQPIHPSSVPMDENYNNQVLLPLGMPTTISSNHFQHSNQCCAGSRFLGIRTSMSEEKDAFYVVRKGDIVGIYRSLCDCQAQSGSSVIFFNLKIKVFDFIFV